MDFSNLFAATASSFILLHIAAFCFTPNITATNANRKRFGPDQVRLLTYTMGAFSALPIIALSSFHLSIGVSTNKDFSAFCIETISAFVALLRLELLAQKSSKYLFDASYTPAWRLSSPPTFDTTSNMWSSECYF